MNKKISLLVILSLLLVLFSGYGAIKLQSFVPPPTYEKISGVTAFDPLYKMVSQGCYTGNSGTTHCWYKFYDNNVVKLYVYSNEVGRIYDYGDMRIISRGGRLYDVYRAVDCQEPTVSFGEISISDTGLVNVPTAIYSGDQKQTLVLSKIEVFAYNGNSWLSLNSQLDPTQSITQNTVFKWQMVKDEVGFLKIKIVNSCGYETDYIESKKITYVTTGSLYVNSTPQGKLKINGVYAGLTPITIPDMSMGAHVYSIELDNYDTISGSTIIYAGKLTSIEESFISNLVEESITDEPNKIKDAILSVKGFFISLMDWFKWWN